MLAIAPGWEMDVDRGPGWLLVRVRSSDPDACDTPPLADQVWSLLSRHFIYRLALELDEVELLHSFLLGQLVLLDKRVRQRGGLMRLCGLSSFNQQVLRTHGLDVRFPTYDDREEAVMGSSHKPR
jgi:anti-anti-sigma factor